MLHDEGMEIIRGVSGGDFMVKLLLCHTAQIKNHFRPHKQKEWLLTEMQQI